MNKGLIVAAMLGGVSMVVAASGWDDPLDPVGITTEAVAKKRQPILRVLHSEGPGGWQFYDDAEPLRGPVVLPKTELLSLDPTLASVRDLQVGWEAIRKSSADAWLRRKAGE